jgi:hypothetical protein
MTRWIERAMALLRGTNCAVTDICFVVGSIFAADDVADDGTRHEDLATSGATAALALADGSVRWRDAGSRLRCGGPLDAATDLDRRQTTVVPVRCRYRGTRSAPPGDAPVSFHGLAVTVEGFDPETGRTTWSVPVGAAQSLAGEADGLAVASQTSFLIRDGDRPLVLDLVTGATRAPAAGEPFWCRTEVEFQYREAYDPNSDEPYERNGGALATPCDAAGRPVDEQPTAGATRTVGASIGSHTAVATTDGVVGFRIG